MTAFAKPAQTPADLLALLKSRGLVVGDDQYALRRLRHIGYYRLSGYMLPYQNGGSGPDRHAFNSTTTFEQVIKLYVFDRRLRLLFLDAIERVEISVRAALSGKAAVHGGSHWYTDPANFNRIDHGKYMAEVEKQLKKSTDVFIEHYYKKYTSPKMPPSWMLFECMSFGTVTLTVKGMSAKHAAELINDFGVNQKTLASWLHCLSYVRNLCAHHSRLWNRVFTIKPFIPNAYQMEMPDNRRLHAQALIICILLSAVAPDHDWAKKLATLFAEFPTVPLAPMGFSSNWKSLPTWAAALA